jgi:hypothetical protein
MRMTESRLRRIIRSVISENMPYDEPDEYMGFGAYGEVEDGDVSLEELEEMLKSLDGKIERPYGYGEVKALQKKYREAKEKYMNKLRALIGDEVEMYGRSSF